MKNKLLLFAAIALQLFLPGVHYSQTITLGSTANYVLFSSTGPVSNTGISALTGDVGTNNGTCSNFSGVVGVVHTMDASTALCATDLLSLYNQLNTTAATLIPVPTLGNGQIITAGAYSITTAATHNATLTFDAQGNSNAVFIIQIQGAFSSNAGAVVSLTNGALACNVYWKVEGAINLGAGSLMKGTFIANNAFVGLGAGVVLQGRAMTTAGSLAVNSITASIPICSNPSPSIITQPVSQTVCAGSSVSFSVSAVGAGLTYQWRKGSVNLVNGGAISGATSSVLTINPASASDIASNYNVMVNGTFLPGVVSVNVSLLVLSAPAFIAQPTNQTACVGTSASFSVTTSGNGIMYQWRKGLVNLSNGGNISGATTNILTLASVALSDAATDYNVVISNTCFPSLTSSNVSLVVNSSPAISLQAASQTVCAGTSIVFGITATGQGLSYQWRKGLVNLSNTGNISGVTTNSLNITAVTAGDAANNYNVVISGLCLPNITSNNITLVVNQAPVIVTQASSQTVCPGTGVTFSISATGSGLIYQWRKGLINLTNGGTLSGATSAQLNISAVTLGDAATNYNVVITGACAPSLTSTSVSLEVSTSPSIVSQPASQTVCAGSPVNFIVIASGSGLTYQWRKGLVNVNNGGLVSGATSSVLTIASVGLSNNAPDYNVVITGLCSPNQTSSNASLLVRVAPSIVTQPLSQTICVGSSATFSIVAAGTGLSYQWRKGTTNLNNGNGFSGANTAVLTINPSHPSHAALNYNVVVSGYCLPDQISNSVALVLNEKPAIIQQQGTQKVCVGGVASFTIQTTGSGLSYQWRKGNTNLVNGGNISGATSSNLVINPVNLSDASANYNVVVTGLCSPGYTSANMALIVNTAPVITTQPNNQMAYLGGSVSFSVLASGSELTYQWRRGTVNLLNGANISGATSSVLTINPVQASDTAANYNVIVTGVCGQAQVSNNAILWVCFCENPTALREDVLVDEVKVFPNPFFGSISVALTETSTLNTCTFILYNMSGIEMLRSEVSKTSSMIDTSQLPAGAYSYTILSADKVIKTGKLISQH